MDLEIEGEQPQDPARPSEDVPEFGSDRRQIVKNAGLCFRVPRPERPQQRNKEFIRARGAGLDKEEEEFQDEDDDEEEEILVIEGVTVPGTQDASFDVFLNLPDADPSTSLACAEYVGSYYHLPHPGPPGRDAVSNMRLGIGGTIKQLGISEVDQLVVTLVHRGAGPDHLPITVAGVRIEYE